MGTIDERFCTHLSGIRDVKDGFREFTVKPYPVGDLSYARAKLETVRGLVASAWTRAPGKGFRLEVTVPGNATATVYVPAGVGDVVKEGDHAAAEAPGVHFLRQADGYAVYRVLSGTYAFHVINSG
jgi:alpha-L-rhamnosidase